MSWSTLDSYYWRYLYMNTDAPSLVALPLWKWTDETNWTTLLVCNIKSSKLNHAKFQYLVHFYLLIPTKLLFHSIKKLHLIKHPKWGSNWAFFSTVDQIRMKTKKMKKIVKSLTRIGFASMSHWIAGMEIREFPVLNILGGSTFKKYRSQDLAPVRFTNPNFIHRAVYG